MLENYLYALFKDFLFLRIYTGHEKPRLARETQSRMK